MRSLVSALAGLPFALALAGSAAATPATFTGTLSIVMRTNDAELFSETVSGSGSADVTLVGGDVDAIAALGAGAFAFAGPTFPITASALVPVSSIRLDAIGAAGGFSGLTSGGGGTMGVDGSFTIGLFGDTTIVTAPTSDGGAKGIGRGGSFTQTGSLNVTLAGAPWTVGSASSGSLSGSGSASGTRVVLVSPFGYTLGPSVPIDGFATLVLDFVPVPEPGTASAICLGLGAIALARRRRG